MKRLQIFLLVLLVIICITCKNDAYKEQKYANGLLKIMEIKDSHSGKKIHYSFYENGNIKSIERYDLINKLCSEKCWFYPSGMIKQKLFFVQGKANGNAYYFYDSSGNLKSSRYYRNDKEVLFGADYWDDSLNLIKSSLHFTDSGIIYSKKNFDKDGSFINEQGRKE